MQEIRFSLDSSAGTIPIEVNAGNNKSKSLDSILEDVSHPYGYKLVNGNIGVAGNKITLPLYMDMFII